MVLTGVRVPLALLSIGLLISGCDKLGPIAQVAAKQVKGSAELSEKGYATDSGRIVRVAEPDGAVLEPGDTFLPGTYVLQGYDETGQAAFTDGWRIGAADGATRVFDKIPLAILQGRMKIEHGSPGYAASDYPCDVGAVIQEGDGRYSATGSCRIVSQGVTQDFAYTGLARQNGFVIDVVRTVSGADASVPPETRFHIVAHIETAEGA